MSGRVDANEFFDLENEVVYGRTVQTDKVSGFNDMYSLDYPDSELFQELEMYINANWPWGKEDKNESRVSEDYQINIDDIVYYAYCGNDSSWNVNNKEKYDDPFYMLTDKCSTQKDGEAKSFSELYEAFTYSDGIYTAELWYYGEIYTFSVSVKDDYVLSMCLTQTSEEEEDGLTFTFKGEIGIKFYDIGKTSITLASEAVKAIEDYIKENS